MGSDTESWETAFYKEGDIARCVAIATKAERSNDAGNLETFALLLQHIVFVSNENFDSAILERLVSRPALATGELTWAELLGEGGQVRQGIPVVYFCMLLTRLANVITDGSLVTSKNFEIHMEYLTKNLDGNGLLTAITSLVRIARRCDGAAQALMALVFRHCQIGTDEVSQRALREVMEQEAGEGMNRTSALCLVADWLLGAAPRSRAAGLQIVRMMLQGEGVGSGALPKELALAICKCGKPGMRTSEDLLPTLLGQLAESATQGAPFAKALQDVVRAHDACRGARQVWRRGERHECRKDRLGKTRAERDASDLRANTHQGGAAGTGMFSAPAAAASTPKEAYASEQDLNACWIGGAMTKEQRRMKRSLVLAGRSESDTQPLSWKWTVKDMNKAADEGRLDLVQMGVCMSGHDGTAEGFKRTGLLPAIMAATAAEAAEAALKRSVSGP